MSKKILFIEDEKEFSRLVTAWLAKKGFVITQVYLAKQTKEELTKKAFDLIILDLGLPDQDGIELCRRIRQKKTTPILILTANDAIGEKVAGLDAGADDYLVKPASLKEMKARICRLLKRPAKTPFRSAIFQFKNIKFETTTGQLAAKNRSVKLTKKEKAVLEYLLIKRGQVLSRTEILDHVWGEEINPFSNAVNVVISSLRRKLKQLAADKFIYSVHGLGYKFDE